MRLTAISYLSRGDMTDDHKPACGLCGNSGIYRDPHMFEPQYCGCVYGNDAKSAGALENTHSRPQEARSGLNRFQERYEQGYDSKSPLAASQEAET